MPTFVFALGCSAQVLPVFNELKNPTMGRMNTIILTISIGVFASYGSGTSRSTYHTYARPQKFNAAGRTVNEGFAQVIGKGTEEDAVACTFKNHTSEPAHVVVRAH